jgi:ribosomal protein S18 acetylase RimI-like enzyme
MSVRRLTADDAAAWQGLRLQALQDAPTAFASSYEEEKDRSLDDVRNMLAGKDGAVFGGFAGTTLACVASVHRESGRKMAHRACVWGVYAAPEARGTGLARAAMRALIVHARDELQVEFLSLGVNVNNAPALRLYEALGFERIGVQRGFLKVDGVLHDEMHMLFELRR